MSLFTIERALQPQDGHIAQLFMIVTDVCRQERLDVFCQCLHSNFPAAAIVVVEPGHALRYQTDLSLRQALSEQQLLDFVQSHRNDLHRFIHAFQDYLSVDASATALVGVGQIGSLLLELSKCDTPLAGRIITFGSRFALLPMQKVSSMQTMHLLCAEHDDLVDCLLVEQAQQVIVRLGGDATIDIEEGVHDSFSDNLHEKMIERLLTCVPLRYWKAAQEEGMETPPTKVPH